MIKVLSIARVDISLSYYYPLLFVLCYMWFGLAEGIIAAFAITISVLIHEFGHALACKRYNLSPSIVLQVLGGVCYHQPAGSDRREAVVVASGPLLQILVGFIALGGMFAVGVFGPQSASVWVRGGMDAAMQFGTTFVFFSIFWGFINLLAPIWPLDGGKLFALILRRFTNEQNAARATLIIGMGLLLLAGIYALTSSQMLLGFIVISIFMQNVQAFQANSTLFMHSSGKRTVRKMSDYGKEMLDDARTNFDQEDYREAARLCHQLRASGEPILPKQLNEIWQILGFSTMEEGDYEDALEWLRRAPQNPRVQAAIARCEEKLRN